MYNCLFVDSDLMLKVKLNGLIEQDSYGYFVPLSISKPDVLRLMENSIVPKFIDGKYILKVGVNNKTIIKFNGCRLDYLGDEILTKIPLKAVILKEGCLRKYSITSKKKNTAYRRRECYAEKMIFTINVKRKRIRINKKDQKTK